MLSVGFLLRALFGSIMLVLTWSGAAAQSPGSGAISRHTIIAELVAANQVLAKLKLVDAFGHISALDPNNLQRFLMARAIAPADVAEQDIMEFDLDSNLVDPKAGPPSIERFIHGKIYKMRADVNAVVHTHSPSVIPFCVTQTRLRPISHVGAFLSPEVGVYDPRVTVEASDLLISSKTLGRALAETLGAQSVVLIREHGKVVVAPNVGLAVYRAYFTEVSAQLLLQARLLDWPIRFLEPDEAAQAESLRRRGYIRQWELWKRELADLKR